MSYTQARIRSNAATHGLHFAVEVEITRFRRAGRSREAAISAALAMVSANIRRAVAA